MGKEPGIMIMWIAGLCIDGGQGSKVILEDIGRFSLVLVFSSVPPGKYHYSVSE